MLMQTLSPRQGQSWEGLQDPLEPVGVGFHSVSSQKVLLHHHCPGTKGDWEILCCGTLREKVLCEV